MAGERQLPGLGLYGFWTLGSNGWNTQNDSNIRVISALLQGRVKSYTTSLPGTPTLGDIYIVPTGDTNAEDIAIWDGASGSEAWVYVTPQAGWLMYVIDEATYYRFDGTNWVLAFAKGALTGLVTVEKTANYDLVASDFTGGVVLDMNVGSVNSVTIPPGLTVRDAVTIRQKGTGITSIVAGSGVTIESADGNTSIASQYGACSIWPTGDAETYALVGNLA